MPLYLYNNEMGAVAYHHFNSFFFFTLRTLKLNLGIPNFQEKLCGSVI